MHSNRVSDWLDSVLPANDQDGDSEHPRKRTKLNNRRACKPGCNENYEGTQSTEGEDKSRLPTLSASPRRSAATAAFHDSDALSLAHSTPSIASSKASKLSRNSSPTKQLRNAKLEEMGFLRASLFDDKKPTLLHALTENLRKIGGGFGILPKELQSDLAGDHSIDFWNFGDAPEFETARLPDLSTVQRIYRLAKRCFTNNHPVSSWNNDVHSRVLDWVLRDGPSKDDIVDYRCCLSAQITVDYEPINAPSKMVDYCICIEPEINSPEYRAIESLCKRRPGKSINHTEWADLTTYPIAVSIETASASSMKLEFLPGIIVMQHHWWFVATALSEDGKTQTFERLLLGETESILGIYKLSMALQKLVEWARDQHWPAFQTDVMGM
ncbi:hypothetical protein QQZ08_000434 [Neonectria magnoliae]|uniref:PD-(D/E)XK nuclease-like domain-containing protein n=1 Tax=Neonectria magnoliae TaxID=2732573 RepID=A0ABR1IJS6_9HYPO